MTRSQPAQVAPKTMRLSTTAGSLRAALAPFKQLIERRPVYPVLACVLIDAGKRTIIGSNLDQWMKVDFATMGKSSGRAAVDYVMLSGLMRHLPVDTEVTIKSDGDLISVSFGSARYELPAMPVGSMPDAGFDDEPTACISGVGFKRAFANVSWAISNEETRYFLNGLCFSVTKRFGEGLVATDGHRMAYCCFAVSDEFDGRILPSTALPILKHLPDAETIALTGAGVSFRWPGMEMVTKLIDGTFPEFGRVWPADLPYSFSLSAADLAGIMRRQEIVNTHHGIGSGVAIALGDDRVAVAASRTTVRGVEFLPYVARQKIPDGCMVLNYSRPYLRATMAALGEDVLTIRFLDNGGPAEMSRRDGSLRTLLMPRRAENNFACDVLIEETRRLSEVPV